MDKKLNRNIFVFLLILFVLSLLLPVLMVTRFNDVRLERKYDETFSGIKQFIQMQNSVYSTISSDNLVKASLLQYSLSSDVMLLQKHLNLLKENFPDIKLLSLYDKSGRLFLSTDYSVVDHLDAASLFRINKPVYGISYMKEYNQYVFSVTAPLYNAFGLAIGYVRVLSVLDPLMDKVSLEDDYSLFLSRNGRIVFIAPSTLSITDEKVLANLDRPGMNSLIIGKTRHAVYSTTDSIEGLRVILAARSFNSVLRILLIINAILLLLVIYFFIRARIESMRKTEDDKLKGTTDELLGYSQKALHNVYTLSDLVSEIRTEKEGLREKIRNLDVSQLAPGGAGKKNEFKIIPPR